MASATPDRSTRFKILRRWKAPRPPTPRWRSVGQPETRAATPPVPALSFFQPETPAGPPEQESTAVYATGRLRADSAEGGLLHRSMSQATQADTEIDTLSQLGSGILTPWPSPQSFMTDQQNEEGELEVDSRCGYVPLELSLPSPLLSPRWMFPRTPPCPPLSRSSSITMSSTSQSQGSSHSTSSTLSCPSSTTSRCVSTCDTELQLDTTTPINLASVGWDVDSPVRLHFGNFKRDSGALRASIIERRLGFKKESEEGKLAPGGQRLGIRVDVIRKGG